MKQWRQIIPFALMITITAGAADTYAASPEFARTEEEWSRLRDDVLEYDEIADLISEYNTTVAGNRIAYKKTKNKDLDDITQQYRDAAGSYSSQATDATTDIEAISFELQEREAEIKADDNVDDGENDRLIYAKDEAALVRKAQQLMNTYNQLLIRKELEESSRQLAAQQLNSVTVMQSQGLATEAEVLSARQAVHNSDAAIINLTGQIEDSRQSLIIMTGWKQGGVPEIKGIPDVDPERVNHLDPAADQEIALQNDYSLQVERRRLEHSASQDNIDLYTTNVKKTEEAVKSAVDLGYQTVLQSYTAYEQGQVALNLANTNLATGQRKYAAGTLSRLELSSLQYKQENAETTFRLREMELFQALQDYDWLLNGLASS